MNKTDKMDFSTFLDQLWQAYQNCGTTELVLGIAIFINLIMWAIFLNSILKK